MITGVAGGMAEYFNLDPVWMRLLWVLGAVFSGGLIIIVYFVMAVVMPSDASLPADGDEGSDADPANAGANAATARAAGAPKATRRHRRRGPGPRAGVVVGVALVVIGGIALLDSLNIFDLFNAWQLWPIILIVIGGAIIYNRRP